MTCDTVLLMEVACDEPKKPLKNDLRHSTVNGGSV